MLHFVVALLCAQPSADVVPVIYVDEPQGSRVELALTNTSDHPLAFVVREDGTVYGPEFGLIHDGKPVKRVHLHIFEGPLASKEIQPGESLPCWMSTSHIYHSGWAPRTVKTIKTGRYELLGRYKMEGDQVLGEAVTPVNLPARQLAILEVGDRFPFNLAEEVYPVRSIVREEAEIELVPVIRLSATWGLEFALVNTSDQPLTFAQNFEGNSVAGLEYSLRRDGETLATEPQRPPPYSSQVVAPGEALRLVTSPAHFQPSPVPASAPGRYELVVSYRAVEVEGLAVTPFEMPARTVAILEILPFEREPAAPPPDSDPALPIRHFESE